MENDAGTVIRILLLIIGILAVGVCRAKFGQQNFLVRLRHQEYSEGILPAAKRRRSQKAVSGELIIERCLKPLSGYKKILKNCYIPKPDGTTTKIDVIMLHELGIFVFESKSFSGEIFGGEAQKYWTNALPVRGGHSQKIQFYNPIMQNAGHIKWLKSYIGEYTCQKFFSCIIFGDGCTLNDVPTISGDHRIVCYRQLPDYIEDIFGRNAYCNTLDESTINDLYKMLYPLTQIDEAKKLAHEQQIKQKMEEQN